MITTTEQITERRKALDDRAPSLFQENDAKRVVCDFVDELIDLVHCHERQIEHILRQKEEALEYVHKAYHEQGHPEPRAERMELVKVALRGAIQHSAPEAAAKNAVLAADETLRLMVKTSASIHLQFIDSENSVLFTHQFTVENIHDEGPDTVDIPRDVQKLRILVNS